MTSTNDTNAAEAAITQANGDLGRRLLLKDAIILSMDPSVADFAKGDILITGDRIEAVGTALESAAANDDVLVVDCAGKIVIPGLQDVHRHCWQGQVRRTLPDVSSVGEYLALFHDSLAKQYRPEDIYIGTLVCSLACIDCGVTNVHDLMHNPRSAGHADAAIRAMQDAGIRATHAQCGVFSGTEGRQWPDDLLRIRNEYFTSDDQLLTLRLAVIGSGNFSPDSIALNEQRLRFARDLGIGLTSDGVIGQASSDRIVELGRLGLLGNDILLTHCLDLSDEAWALMAEHGVGVALTPTSDAQFGISEAIAPIQKVIDFGIEAAGIAVDSEINLTTDLFEQMHAMLVIQRALIFNRRYREGLLDARGLNVKDVLEFATIKGAKATANDHKVGSISPGKQADLVVLDPGTINVLPLNDVYGAVVSACDSRNVEAVFIAGIARKWNGRLLGQDIRGIGERAAASRDYLFEKSGLTFDIFNAPSFAIGDRDYHGHGQAALG